MEKVFIGVCGPLTGYEAKSSFKLSRKKRKMENCYGGKDKQAKDKSGCPLKAVTVVCADNACSTILSVIRAVQVLSHVC